MESILSYKNMLIFKKMRASGYKLLMVKKGATQANYCLNEARRIKDFEVAR